MGCRGSNLEFVSGLTPWRKQFIQDTMRIGHLYTKQNPKQTTTKLLTLANAFLLKDWVGVGERCSTISGVRNAWTHQTLTHRGHSLPVSWVASGGTCRSEGWLWPLAHCVISPGTSALWKEADQMAQEKIKIRWEKNEIS